MLLALVCTPPAALPLDETAPLGEGAFEMISINADEASEDIVPGVLHFNGHFLMQSHDWRLTANRATVYGSPDRPDRVQLHGSPARFQVGRPTRAAGKGPLDAAASVVEYLREENILRLSGGATLSLDRQVIRSEFIEYDIGTEAYRAGGAGGVKIELPPRD